MIKSFLAIVGAIVLIMWAAGMLGIGNFYIYYGVKEVSCIDGDADDTAADKRPVKNLRPHGKRANDI